MRDILVRNRTWVGFFVKSSGDLVAVGRETYGGVLWRLDDPQNKLTFSCENWRLGGGLGGNVSLGLIIFFNVGNLGYVERQSIGHGWGLSLNVPVAFFGRYASLAQALKKMQGAWEVLTKHEEMITVANEIWKAMEKNSNQPIIHIASELGGGLSAGLMRSFSGKIDIRTLEGQGGYIADF